MGRGGDGSSARLGTVAVGAKRAFVRKVRTES